MINLCIKLDFFLLYIGLYYDKIKIKLSQPTEEVATFYAEVFNENHQLTKNDLFNKNFFSDWKCVMTEEEKMKILDLKKCDFGEIGESNFKNFNTRWQSTTYVI